MSPPAWLDALLTPRSIALVGVSDDPTRVAGRALSFLKRYGYAGDIFPVNTRVATVQGLPAFKSVAELPCAPSLALISLRADRIHSAVQACIERGVDAAIIYASGFAEQDRAGAKLQAELKEMVAASPMRVLGPNCLGAVSSYTGVTATFATAFDDGELAPGSVALLTQSGAFASFVYAVGRAAGVGFGFLATTGNEMDLTIGELLGGVIEQPQIGSALVHIESIRDVDVFRRAATRARELHKPLAVIKVGRSEVGALAARAHTNADVGSDEEYDPMFDELGIQRVETMAELADAGQVFQSAARPAGRRVTILSVSGGTGVLMADAAAKAGLDVPELPPDVRGRLDALLQPFASSRNPVDVTGAVFDDLTTFEQVVKECVTDESTDLVLVAVGNATATEHLITEAILTGAQASTKPIYVAWVGGSGAPARRLVHAGVPTFDDPTRAVRAAAFGVRTASADDSR